MPDVLDTLGYQPDTQPELREYQPSLAERLKGGLQDLMMAGGASAYPAGHIAGGLTGLLSAFPPTGVPLAADEMQRAAGRGDIPGTAIAAMGVMPGAGPEAKLAGAVAKEGKAVASEAAPVAEQAVEKAFNPVSFAEFTAGAPPFKPKQIATDDPRVQYVAQNIEDIHAELSHSYPALAKKLELVVNDLRAANTNIDRSKVLDELDQSLSMVENAGGNNNAVRRLGQLIEHMQELDDEPFLQHMQYQSQLQTGHKHYNDIVQYYAEQTPPEKAHEYIQSLEQHKLPPALQDEMLGHAEKLAAKDSAKLLRQKYPEAAATVDAQNAYRAEQDVEFKKKHPRLWKRRQQEESEGP